MSAHSYSEATVRLAGKRRRVLAIKGPVQSAIDTGFVDGWLHVSSMRVGEALLTEIYLPEWLVHWVVPGTRGTYYFLDLPQTPISPATSNRCLMLIGVNHLGYEHWPDAPDMSDEQRWHRIKIAASLAAGAAVVGYWYWGLSGGFLWDVLTWATGVPMAMASWGWIVSTATDKAYRARRDMVQAINAAQRHFGRRSGASFEPGRDTGEASSSTSADE